MKRSVIFFVCLLAMLCVSGYAAAPEVHPGDAYYPRIQSAALPEPDELGNIIPDFSRIGYRWGDEPIPDVPVVVTLSPPKNGEDAHAMIQAAIDQVSKMNLNGKHRGAILLKKGTYHISDQLNIDESGIVLRGEGNTQKGTVLVATRTEKHNLINFLGGARIIPSHPRRGSAPNIKDDYVPVGRFWVRVTNPEDFTVGDAVILYRPASEQWISDIKMDQITVRPGQSSSTRQWEAPGYVFRMERVVTMVRGDTLHFDNPCVMALDRKYGGGSVFKYRYERRLNECGVENMLIRSVFAGDEDEDHGWMAISFRVVEHGWVRNVDSEYFGMGLVSLGVNAKNITVQNCECRLGKSIVRGGRRYSFELNGSLCLVYRCRSFDARHDFATGARQAGPSAFVYCTAERTRADIGPHHRWNMGTLYDNVVTDGAINVQDRQYLGSGHGWAGVNQVLWNCTAKRVTVQSPWASARNYSIGTIGEKHPGAFPDRPDGVWISHGKHVKPRSLYEAQLELRKSRWPDGVFSVGK